MAETRKMLYQSGGLVRGECSVCGAKADGRSTKCPDHGGPAMGAKKDGPAKESAPKIGPDLTVQRPGPAPSVTSPPDDKAKRSNELAASIMADLNPLMPQAFAFLCRPIPPDNFFTVSSDGKQMTVTPLGQSAQFAAWEAKFLGKAAAELEEAPIAKAMVAGASPMLPYFYVVGAVAVVGFHGWNMMNARTQLLVEWQKVNDAAQAAQQPHEAGPVTSPEAGDGPAPADPDPAPFVDPADLPDIGATVGMNGRGERVVS